MAFAPIPEYEGKSPYVFITYAQQDEKIAYSIAVKMYNEGFRIWSSAACGNPSNMRIAERLSNSEVAMVFLSKSYLKYASYKEFEPRAVMNSPKQKIVICLDDTPVGTDWNMVDFPAGIRYNPDVPQGLWLRINSSDTLERCRGAWPRNPMPLPYEEKPVVDMTVNQEELTDELSNLNSVMSSFGAGLDDEEIKNITLFRKDDPSQSRFKWPEKQENTQEQEYYAIENLIDTAPMPTSPEKKQYDNMIGLIESFMEKSSRVKEEELQKTLNQPAEETPLPQIPAPSNTYGDYRPIPKNEFDKVDLAKDTAAEPVVITHSSDIRRPDSIYSPIVVNDSIDTESSSYSMTRKSSRSDRFSFYQGDKTPPAKTEPIVIDEPKPAVVDKPKPIATHEPKHTSKKETSSPEPKKEIFEKIVDDRKLMTSTEDNAENARLTYHLGSAFSGFDERDYLDDEPEPPKPEPPKPEPPKPEPKFEPVNHTPVRFQDDDIPLPALSFEKPKRPLDLPEVAYEKTKPAAPPEKKRTLSKPRRRYIVSVRRGIRHTEYENEMYEVNGRWIPGEIYHRLMPNAKYTAIRRINRTTQSEPVSRPVSQNRPGLNADSKLFNAVSTFFSPAPRQNLYTTESIPDDVRAAMRERHDVRRAEAIRQYEEENLTAAQNNRPETKAPAAAEGDNTPARKHKFSHEGGIKKSLMANMETPVNTSAEESHRQYGARAEAVAELTKAEKKNKKADEKAAKKAAKKAAEKAAQKKAEAKKNDKKNKKQGKSESKTDEKKSAAPLPPAVVYDDHDDDSLIELPQKNIPNIDYDPRAYSNMNLSEILFGGNGDSKKNAKHKKKK